MLMEKLSVYRGQISEVVQTIWNMAWNRLYIIGAGMFQNKFLLEECLLISAKVVLKYW